MASIYSTLFFAVPAGSQGDFPVPAGFVAVVRMVTARTTAGASNPQYLVYISSPNVVICQGFVHVPSAADATASVARDLRVVVPAGRSIVSLNDAGVDMSVSGYLFANP